MKFHIKISAAVALAMALAVLIGTDFVRAQEYPMRPFLGPTWRAFGTQPRLYIEAGVVYKRINGFRFEAHPGGGITLVTGGTATVPWGPSTDGAISGFTATSDWTYTNGSYLRGANPGGLGNLLGDPNCADCAPPPPVAHPSTQPNIAWSSAAAGGGLGEQYVQDQDGNCTNGDCVDWYNRYVGTFQVTDPATEANSTIIDTTTELSFTYTLDSNLAAVPGASPAPEPGLDVLAPYLEIGSPAGQGFDWFAGLSWYNVGDSFRTTVPYTGIVFARAAVDTFPFTADADPAGAAPWGAGPYIGAPANYNALNRLVSPNSGTRAFLETALAGLGQIAEQQVQARVDATVIDMKFGGRSWYPLYGLGRFGVSTGFLFAPTPYTIVLRQLIRTTADILDPNTGALLLPANTVIAVASDRHDDIWWNAGWFGGLDLLVGTGRVYARGTLEYDLYFNKPYDGAVSVRFLPRGLSASGTLGLRF